MSQPSQITTKNKKNSKAQSRRKKANNKMAGTYFSQMVWYLLNLQNFRDLRKKKVVYKEKRL